MKNFLKKYWGWIALGAIIGISIDYVLNDLTGKSHTGTWILLSFAIDVLAVFVCQTYKQTTDNAKTLKAIRDDIEKAWHVQRYIADRDFWAEESRKLNIKLQSAETGYRKAMDAYQTAVNIFHDHMELKSKRPYNGRGRM